MRGLLCAARTFVPEETTADIIDLHFFDKRQRVAEIGGGGIHAVGF